MECVVMGAAETIAAAIEKLEEWRREVDVPPVVRWFDQEHIPGWDGFIVIGDSGDEGDDCNPVARVYTEELADMLIGLHRTIDAQLILLGAGRHELEQPIRDAGPRSIVAAATTFARAILGES
jgi:hypothetical protein